MNTEDRKRWGKSLVIFLIVFLVLSLYLFLRRGYYNLYIINKVLGSSAVIIAGLTLVVGPLSKRFSIFTGFMTIRRHLGLLAFGSAMAHVVASLVQTQRFEWFSWYLREWIPVFFGILALGTWVYMTYISRNSKIKQLGVDIWKKRLSLGGNIAFLAIFLHLTTMKYEGWIRWFNGQTRQTSELANPSYPPASLFIFIVMVLVIAYRIYLYFKYRSS